MKIHIFVHMNLTTLIKKIDQYIYYSRSNILLLLLAAQFDYKCKLINF